MEASTLRPAATLPKPRLAVGAPLLRLRSDDQLVALFRAGHDEAFRAIHDRYHRRLFAYARQMLPARQDAEDVLQDVFVRAYDGLRASDRDLALRAWLFRVAHNRCVDQLRSRPTALPHELFQLLHAQAQDPLAEVDMRESLRRLVSDIRRLPDQQRSALLMRELGGMTYVDIAGSLGVSVGAVKSLLVRARLALAQASEARDTSCAVIRAQLVEAHDRGVRPNANARKHLRDCTCCKSFRRELRGVSRQLAAVAPVAGPLGVFAKLLGFSGGGGAAGGAGGSVALLGGGGTSASAGGLALGTTHVATLIVAAVATAGGAVELQRAVLPPVHHPASAMSVSPKLSRHHPIAALPSAAAPVQAAPGRVAPLVASDPSSASAGPPASTKSPVKRTVRSAPHRLRAGPVTVYGLPRTTATATAGAAAGGTCGTSATDSTTAGGAGSSAAGSSSSPQATSTTTSAATTPSTGEPATVAPATSTACGSSTGSSAAGSSSTNGSTVAPIGSGTSTTATTTSASSSTSGTTASSTGTGSPASGSNSTSE